MRSSCDQGAPVSPPTLGVALAPVTVMFAFTEPLMLAQKATPAVSFALPSRSPSPLAPPPQTLS
jgi:hypothetical protein